VAIRYVLGGSFAANARSWRIRTGLARVSPEDKSMRWSPGATSGNIEDRRGSPGMRGLPIGKMGIGGTIILGILSLIFGRNLLSGGGEEAPVSRPGTAEEEQLVKFVSFVLDDAQNTWQKTLPSQSSTRYRDAKLVLFTDATESACGYGESATGPFYCPADEKVYIDLGFYGALKQKLGAPGDFAQAYVIAHELGHHVQNLLGTDDAMRKKQRRASATEANELSVRMELQADCYAGIWAHSTGERQLLEEGDIEEGLGAAAAIGDDRLQKAGSGRVQPEKWTHGSSAMRVRWFKRGYETGRMDACDTFAVESL
jgi:hypothetical protein